MGCVRRYVSTYGVCDNMVVVEVVFGELGDGGRASLAGPVAEPGVGEGGHGEEMVIRKKKECVCGCRTMRSNRVPHQAPAMLEHKQPPTTRVM